MALLSREWPIAEIASYIALVEAVEHEVSGDTYKLSDTQVRNKKFTREDYEAVFEHYLGAHNTIWLEAGIVGDDTHGHVDDITRFVNETTIVTAVEKDKTDPNYELLKENLKRLKKAKNVNGKPFNIVEIPMPRPVMFEGQRLPASYANFLICNKVVLPTTILSIPLKITTYIRMTPPPATIIIAAVKKGT